MSAIPCGLLFVAQGAGGRCGDKAPGWGVRVPTKQGRLGGADCQGPAATGAWWILERRHHPVLPQVSEWRSLYISCCLSASAGVKPHARLLCVDTRQSRASSGAPFSFTCRFLQEKRRLNGAEGVKCYFFNTFFYTKLTEYKNDASKSSTKPPAAAVAGDAGAPGMSTRSCTPPEQEDTQAGPAAPAALTNAQLRARAAFQRVRRWTKHVNIFEFDFVFIPINMECVACANSRPASTAVLVKREAASEMPLQQRLSTKPQLAHLCVFLPLCCCREHWSLMVACHFNKFADWIRGKWERADAYLGPQWQELCHDCWSHDLLLCGH